jgi:hypothetical protein
MYKWTAQSKSWFKIQSQCAMSSELEVHAQVPGAEAIMASHLTCSQCSVDDMPQNAGCQSCENMGNKDDLVTNTCFSVLHFQSVL